MTRFTKIFFKEMEKLDYIYFVDRSEKGFKCQLKYIDGNQIIQTKVDRRCVTNLVDISLRRAYPC